MKVIVTGSAGYIGGQVALQLRDAGHEVYGIDRREPPAHLRGVVYRFLYKDFASDVAIDWIKSLKPDAIIHCAGTSLVGPSVTDPSEYYNNNVVNTVKMIDMVRTSLPNTRVIFSSSASVYGIPFMNPCHEVDLREPISPYGESKMMIEMVLEAYHRAYNLDYVNFRYFNACGADPEARHGQEPGATHIIARVLESIRDQQAFTLYGSDYPTDDGTCVRDYVHVDDIARAHVMALDSKIPSGIYNLGSNTGTSNRAIIAAAEAVTGKPVQVAAGSQRAGDPAILVASADKFSALAEWRKYELTDMVKHAWAWYVR
jgi:UDP-glucose 4-epimerase